MKRNIVRTIFSATLLLSLAALALAQNPPTCSIAGVAGAWGYTETGTAFLASGTAIPYASVGRYTVGSDGNLSGARTASAGGTIMPATIKGTATVNSDCTGTLTLNFYDQSGTLTGTAIKALVYLNNMSEARSIITSATAVLTTDAKKVSPPTWVFRFS